MSALLESNLSNQTGSIRERLDHFFGMLVQGGKNDLSFQKHD